GNVVRLTDGVVVLPGNMALGATRSPQLAFRAGGAQGEDLRLVGFNMNLAPVLETSGDPRNPTIGTRAFGDDAALAAELGAAFVRGQQQAGIATVAKHFPGHGRTPLDSHSALPVLEANADELEAMALPFTRAMAQGLDGLMVAHVAI